MDESLVGSPGFKPVREALILSWVGSIPTRLRQYTVRTGSRRPPPVFLFLAVFPAIRWVSGQLFSSTSWVFAPLRRVRYAHNSW